MGSQFKEIEQRINEALSSKEIYVTSIEIRREKQYKFLTIELDKVGGLDLDAIVEASEIVNPIVDEFDLVEDSYILDIVSKERKDNDE